MESHLRSFYFVLVKFVGILGLICWGIMQTLDSTFMAGSQFLLGALFLLCSVMTDIDSKHRRLWIIGEGIPAVIAVFLFPVIGIYFAVITFLDAVSGFAITYYLACYLLLVFVYTRQLNVGMCFLIITFLFLLYLQNYKIIGWYKKIVGENIATESQLKSDMEHSNVAHRNEMRESRLRHDNELLEEKARISQALHDKLGHSINGSLYQLEAAKVLMSKKPEESEKILQEVIDNLRGSMDEIRVIIRNERPDKKRMALKSLQALCAECEEQYNIKANLEVQADDKEIPENIWDVILDNSFEAVTNALKYSGCTEISISINALGEVVRCVIKDNGKGAENYEESMGIQGMKQRVRNVKGYLDIESMGGFTINMILPIKKQV
ncbi:MAG: histidine kinase [Saccharofermentans sp.]|nr:histidine kinase [Saccharofermentans sp.]